MKNDRNTKQRKAYTNNEWKEELQSKQKNHAHRPKERLHEQQKQHK